MRMRRLLIAVALVGAALPLAVGMRSEAYEDLPRTSYGYIPVAQGTPDATTLHYKVTLPDPNVWGDGPYPTVVDYSGYRPGIYIYDGLDDRFLAHGYAVAGINIRGTGCSGGKFDYFEPLQSRDGAEAIEFLAKQPWSGRVGMVGKSYPGITQLFVASEKPPSLKAIVPGHVFGDLYRDVPFPGGIMNVTFSAGWSAGRVTDQVGDPRGFNDQVNPAESLPDGTPEELRDGVETATEADDTSWQAYAQKTGDQQCIRNQVDHTPNPAFNPFVRALQPQNNWDNDLFHERSPFWWADKIDAPTMLVESWQDEQVGSRATHLLERLRPEVAWKFIGTNGDHGEYYGDAVFPHILRFLSYHLKQEIPAGDQGRTVTETVTVPAKLPNGKDHPTKKTTTTVTRPETFADALARYVGPEDDVIINWENTDHGQGKPRRKPAWTATYPSWPVADAKAPWRLQLGSDGKLADTGAPGAVDYAYVPEVGSQERGGYELEGLPAASWGDRPPDGTAAMFTTAPLETDKVLLGSASLDLVVSSTAPDTDFEVTLSEVRDGKEMFVQQGWLRASHRKEDPALSNPLRPFQTHLVTDTQPLVPGQPTPMRIELFPFGHVFRAGSQLRITVAAPHVQPDLWGFVALPLPAQNSIVTGPGGSSLALPLVDGAAEAPFSCNLRSQPCRDEPAS